MPDNAYWNNNSVSKEVLQLMALLCQSNVAFKVIPQWVPANVMQLSFFRRQWYIDMLTGTCYMIHAHSDDDGNIVHDRTQYETIDAMKNFICTEYLSIL